jgi:hypothetical protein
LIPSYWYSPLATVAWQIVIHSLVAAVVFVIWSRHVELPSGRSRRRVLCALLVLPLATALIPGRNADTFREQVAWLDSARILAIPLVGGLHVYHFVLAVLALSTLASLWQEVMPMLRRIGPDLGAAPEDLVRRVRSLPGWERCRVGVTPDAAIFVATAGWPSRPRLIVSAGALAGLGAEERDAVLLHENAHWQRGRWAISHLLFAVRIVQCYNPIALWAFREYSIEVEIDCDADAVAGRDPRAFVRALLKVYETTGRRELSARRTLQKRVDILLKKRRREDEPLAGWTVVLATLLLMGLLPWIV